MGGRKRLMQKKIKAASVHSTTTQEKVFAPDAIDDRFIHEVYQYHYLRADQLTQLLYKPGNLTTVKARLKRLVDNGYLLAITQPTVKFKSPYVYLLSAKAIAYLKEQGADAERYYIRPSEAEEKSYFFLNHTLSIADCLIAAHNLTSLEPKVTIASWEHDLVLKHDPCMVTIERKTQSGKVSKETIRLVPDFWIDFRIDRGAGVKERKACCWFEIDRETVEVKQFKNKVRGSLTFLNSGGYTERFGTTSLTVAYATTGGKARVEQMRTSITSQLEPTKEKPGVYNLFLCA